jgi:hypothetical protein
MAAVNPGLESPVRRRVQGKVSQMDFQTGVLIEEAACFCHFELEATHTAGLQF